MHFTIWWLKATRFSGFSRNPYPEEKGKHKHKRGIFSLVQNSVLKDVRGDILKVGDIVYYYQIIIKPRFGIVKSTDILINVGDECICPDRCIKLN